MKTHDEEKRSAAVRQIWLEHQDSRDHGHTKDLCALPWTCFCLLEILFARPRRASWTVAVSDLM